MPDHPGRLPGIVLIATAIFLGSCPAAWAQRDVDRVVKEAMDAWKEGSPAWREQAFQLMTSLGATPARSSRCWWTRSATRVHWSAPGPPRS